MKNVPLLTKASELFEAMGSCKRIAVLGTKLDKDNKIPTNWNSYSDIHKNWIGQIVSMKPESKGGLHWLVELKRRCVLCPDNNCSACKVNLFVRCKSI